MARSLVVAAQVDDRPQTETGERAMRASVPGVEHARPVHAVWADHGAGGGAESADVA
jgi:hypothetical protein